MIKQIQTFLRDPWFQINLRLVLFFVLGFFGTYLTDFMVQHGVFEGGGFDHPRYNWWLVARISLGIWYGLAWGLRLQRAGAAKHWW